MKEGAGEYCACRHSVHELAAKEQALGAGAKYSAEKLAIDPGKSVGNFPSKTRDHVGTVAAE
jgi:hypothetical protein